MSRPVCFHRLNTFKLLFIHSVNFLKNDVFGLQLLKEMLLSWFPQLTLEKQNKKKRKEKHP